MRQPLFHTPAKQPQPLYTPSNSGREASIHPSATSHQVLFHPKVCSVVSELVQLCESAGCQPTCSLQQDRFCILQGGSTVLVWDACDPGQPPVELDCGSSMVNTGTIVMVPTRTAAEWGVVVFWRHLGGKLRYWRQWLRSEEYVDCTLDFDETMDQSPSCAIPLPFGGVLLGFTEGAVAQVTLPFLQRGSSTTPTARLGKRPASFLKRVASVLTPWKSTAVCARMEEKYCTWWLRSPLCRMSFQSKRDHMVPLCTC